MEESDMMFPFFEPDEPAAPESDKAPNPSESVESGISSLFREAQEEEHDFTTHEAENSTKEEKTEIDSPSTANSPENLDTDHSSDPQDNLRAEEDPLNKQPGQYFYYDPPLYEETGMWIPVSVPPMTGTSEDWQHGFGSDGAYFPDEEFRWDPLEPNTQMTMWDVFTEMLVAAKGKVSSLVSLNAILGYHMSLVSTPVPLPPDVLQEAWKEMAQTLSEVHFGYANGLLETEPVRWLPDSVSTSCMLCSAKFHPIICSRHHCRFCGGLFCSDCSKGRSLLPPKFRATEPQRVCDVCCVRLEGVQPYLMGQVSRASQPLIHDLTDLSTLRSWLNFPWARTMEYEIYKAANSIRSYCKVGKLKPEKSIPESILKQAKGLAIITVANVGMMVTYKIGTGLVVARREDGSWSAPSAISTFGLGWGAQAGGEITDYIIVLRNKEAIRTFCGSAHMSVGAGVSAAAGSVGRAAEADLRAGDGGYAACYTYSCSKGAFVGCALNGSMVTTRSSENARFYGMQMKASDILLGSVPRPQAAAILYQALSNLFDRIQRSQSTRYNIYPALST
ncbi:hypothetical protein LUZ63_015178 [Rhynchospora breviuscula]|uniref:FYVE-type domain-containing protein n=1 Tax=Rhynchospora breviuscula TaxID=2022672 RepID=A0A9Q0CBT9_9POAL|nr:hypothetical protein LUZ63_015178 [Rhynchospora breviuscula]